MAAAMALLTGCTESGEPAGGAGGTETGDLPSPWSDGTGMPDGMPSMSKEQAVASALTGLRSFVALRPSGVVEAFEALAVFEEGCPEEQRVTEEGDVRVIEFYSEGCTTSTGLEIVGAGRLDRWTGLVEDGRTSSGASLSGEDGTFRLAKGNRWLEFSGYLDYDVGTYADGETDGYLYIGGEAAADPQTAENSPLLHGAVRAQGEIYAYRSGGYRLLGGSGSMSGPGLGDALAVSFGNFVVAPDECGTEPAGTVSVRDGGGFWHDMAFDAATFEDIEDEPQWHRDACDGCGTYLAGGVEDGTACVGAAEIDPLVDWEEVPW